MSRVGIYGGSFNPPHVGHTLAARELVGLLGLSKLLVIPAATPPHKALPEGSPAPEDRLAMTKLAFASLPEAEVLDLELRREGPSYTVDTLTVLKTLYPDDELILLMGSDMLLTFDQWYRPAEIAALATLAVMHRDEDPNVWRDVERKAEQLRQTLNACVLLTENHCVSVSSTGVRRLLAMRAPGALDPAVEAEIVQHGWYRCREDFTNLPYEQLKEVSLSLHDPKRCPHVLGCSETAEALARHWGEDPETARRAGILHDITKALDAAQQLHLCRRYGIVLSELQLKNPKLLHAKTGAVIAREVFGESDAVYNAIYWHTTGKAGMTTMEKILYIADYMEPNRKFPGVEMLRTLVWKDLDAAMYYGLDLSMQHLRKQSAIVDPDSMAAWVEYGKRSERSNRP